LAAGREQEVVVICRSGKRSVLAADTLQRMGYVNVVSLKTGVRGWNDYEQPMTNAQGESLDADDGDAILASKVRAEQHKHPVS
jgi:3-mercaptopyruvate sulfurtransferase SseA